MLCRNVLGSQLIELSHWGQCHHSSVLTMGAVGHLQTGGSHLHQHLQSVVLLTKPSLTDFFYNIRKEIIKKKSIRGDNLYELLISMVLL